MIIYFTGTGNSRFIANTIAKQLHDEVIDAFTYIKNNKKANINSVKPLIFVSPTYAWRLPLVFVEFIQQMKIEGNTDAYFIMTCGENIGNAPAYIEKLCESINLHYKGVAEIVMPENYIAMFPVPDEKESEIIVEKALTNLQQYIQWIQEYKDFPRVKKGFIEKRQSGIVNNVFYKVCVKDHAFYATDDCISCGICEQKCPLNNIKLRDGKPKWMHHCTHCMACICYCPKSAIEYGKKSKGKRRYRFEDYKEVEND